MDGGRRALSATSELPYQMVRFFFFCASFFFSFSSSVRTFFSFFGFGGARFSKASEGIPSSSAIRSTAARAFPVGHCEMRSECANVTV